jgi:hypothetical protein
MGAENLNSRVLSAYFFRFRRDAHQLLAWGYEDSLTQIHCDLEEEEITGLIVEAMRKRLRRLVNPNLPERFDRYFVDEERLVSVEGRTGKRRRRLDIVVESSLNYLRPEYIFEAKRLRKNGYPIGEYVGKDGLQCYIKEIYASKYPEAAMVGYIQSDAATYWENELKRRFNHDPNNDLCIKQILQKTQVLTSLPDAWVSEHERVVSGSITVYHIFLNCSASST